MQSCRRSFTGTFSKLIGDIAFNLKFNSNLSTFTFLSLNEILRSSDYNKKRSHEFEMFAPPMPLNASSLHILFEVKNTSAKFDRDVRISKNFLCDCKKRAKDVRIRGKGCKHLKIADIRPNTFTAKAHSLTHLEIMIRYEVVGCHGIIFNIK